MYIYLYLCVCLFVCVSIRLYFRQRGLSNGHIPSSLPTKIYAQHTCNNYVLHASPNTFTLFDHPKNIVSIEYHEASHRSNSNRPRLYRSSKELILELFHILYIFKFSCISLQKFKMSVKVFRQEQHLPYCQSNLGTAEHKSIT
jgi:hypothetical protein